MSDYTLSDKPITQQTHKLKPTYRLLENGVKVVEYKKGYAYGVVPPRNFPNDDNVLS